MAILVGADQSGNANFWTPNNISISGATNDSMVDVPGIASVSNQRDIGGVTRGNYCTLNPILRQYATTDSTSTVQPSEEWADGNLRVFWKHDGVSGVVSGTMAMPNTGKWYFEYTNVYEPANAPVRYGQWVGLLPADSVPAIGGTYAGGLNGSGYAYSSEGALYRSAFGGTDSGVDSFATYGTGDVIGIAYDGDNRKISWYKNNTLIVTESNIPLIPTGWLPSAGGIKQNTGSGWNTSNIPGQGLFNFGATPFIHTPPTGFKSLCTTNLPNPVIKRSNDHFDVKTWVGNGSNLTLGVNSKESSAYPIERSLKFNASASGHLTRTPATASNRRTWTYSAWIKRSVLGTRQSIFSAGTGNLSSAPGGGAYFTSSTNKIEYIMGGGTSCAVTTDRPFTDTRAWMHLVIAMDTTQVAPAQRLKMYVDGVQITGFSSTTYPNQNFETDVNNAVIHAIGSRTDDGTMPNTVANYYLAEVNFIDGSAKIPSDFGAYDANNNWMPQRYTGTYGTNGFYLPFNQVPTTSTFAASFNGSNQGLLTTASGLNASTGTWTVEGWAFSTNSAANEAIITGQVSGTDYFYWNYGGTTLYFGDGVTNTIVLNSVKPTNRWFHWAAVKNGSTYTLYIDGRAIGSSTTAFRSGTLTQWQIGQRTSQSYFWSGYISNVRVNTTTAVYTTNFKPPVAPLTAISGTQLLTLQSSTIVDNSTNAYTFTNNGSVATAASTIVFANGSVLASDQSGNNNVWSGNNILITDSASGKPDSVFDSPADGVDASGNISGNYPIMAPNSNYSLTDGALKIYRTGATQSYVLGSLPISYGKFYWEVTVNTLASNYPRIGIAGSDAEQFNNYPGGNSGTSARVWAGAGGSNLAGISPTTTGALFGTGGSNSTNVTFTGFYSAGDVVMFALDKDNNKLWVGKNGTWYTDTSTTTTSAAIANNTAAAAFSDLGMINEVYPAIFCNQTADIFTMNFGQTAFSHTPPTGFKSINSKNLKDVGSYNLPDSFGNFVTTPDLAWMKSRTNGGYRHQWADTVRGPRNILFSNDNTAQATFEGVQSFIPNGVTIGPENGVNEVGGSHVGWFWNRGKTPGFDIVTYGGNSVNGRMIPHNLGQVPAMYITKCLTSYNNTNSFVDWNVWHKNLEISSYGGNKTLYLNSNIQAGAAGGYFANPTSNEFSPNQTLYDNVSGQSYVAYLWAEVPGFSKFGTYAGNTNASGPFVYCGFKPKWVMVKKYNSANDSWIIYDSARNTVNGMQKWLVAHATDSEYDTSSGRVDFVSNGFKIRTADAGPNTGNFIYMAFAEAPFKYATAR